MRAGTPAAAAEAARAFMSRDVLRNIVPLKMLAAYGDAIRCHWHEGPDGEGALLLLPTRVSHFDRGQYPETEYCVLLSTTGPAVTRALLAHVPRGRPLIFKLVDDAARAAVAEVFALRRATAFQSFTTAPGAAFTASPLVDVAAAADDGCCELFAAQGHARDEIEGYFAAGRALAFAVREGGTAVAACLTYENFGAVHEVGAVYTRPEARRRGLARALVETALAALAARRRIPRYQVLEDNRASIALAESLGLRRFATIEHWLHA